MIRIPKGFFQRNCTWIALLIMSIGSLYSKPIVAVLPLFVFIYVVTQMRIEKTTTGRWISFLINYLPFYTLIRVGFIFLGFERIANLLNYLRDVIIIILLLRVFFRKGVKFRSFDILWIVFIINWITGIIVSGINGYLILGISGFHLTAIPLLLYYIIVYNDEEIQVERIKEQIIRIAIIVAIYGMIAYIQRPTVYCELFATAGNEVNAADYVRFVSVFLTPNVCGSFMATVMIITLVDYIHSKKIILLLETIIFLICLILTLSRGAWAFAIISTIILICFIKPKLGFPLLAIMLSLLAYDFISGGNLLSNNNILSTIIRDRARSIFDKSEGTPFDRVLVGFGYFKLLQSNPFGFGLGVASTAQMAYGNLSGVGVVDGFYLKSIVETGIIGILFVFSFVVWVISRSIKAFSLSKDTISTVALLIVIGFLSQSVGSNPFDFVCVSPYLWIVLGISVKRSNNFNIINELCIQEN